MKLKKRLQLIKTALHMELREHKSSFLVYMILRVLVIVMLVLQIFNGNYENVFLCALTLILLTLPSLIQVNFKIELPTGLEITILVFIFAAEILGEIRAYYVKFPFWDTALHTINGFLMAAIGFALVDILNRSERVLIKLSPVFLAIVAFCFSMTVGVIWEFFEFTMDQVAGLDMQKDTVIHHFNSVLLDETKSNIPVPVENITQVTINGNDLGVNGYLDIGLIDTMQDLFVNFIGAVVFAFIGFFYVKNRGTGKLAKRFIPSLKSQDTDFLKKAELQEKEEAELH